MKESCEFYQSQLADIGTDSCFGKLKLAGQEAFNNFKLPARTDEEWKYTALTNFYTKRFVPASESTAKTALPKTQELKISVINGVLQQQIELANGVVAMPIREAAQSYSHIVEKHLASFEHSNGFQALNTAFLQQGVFIYLPRGVKLDEPVVISHKQEREENAAYLRHLIVAEEGSCASVVEDYYGESDYSYFTNSITEIVLASDSKLTHYKVQRESKRAFHYGYVSAQQQQDSEFLSHSFSFGGNLVRSDTSVTFADSGAACLLNGLYMPGDKQHIDHHTTINHAHPNCDSEQNYKGVLSGSSRAVFNGRVIVAPDAQKTDARQQNKNILLSQNAEIDTLPQLEIFANDVSCTHGATVGQLDEEALFYLATRGISHAQARDYLVRAFAHENINLVPDESVKQWIQELLGQTIGSFSDD